MERVTEQRKPRRPDRRQDDTVAPTERSADPLKHDLDELLDEIDAVLEENAEEFVKAYVQKGGE